MRLRPADHVRSALSRRCDVHPSGRFMTGYPAGHPRSRGAAMLTPEAAS